ncbi:MAG TPA: HU family DNA-binding protein [Sporichthya sp.]|nr:HU family DNA-binding protein [Sporichthya sp.]
MNKTQLIDELAIRFNGNKKAASQALDAVVDTITRAVARGEKVGITGFGVFEKVERPARLARNPATGAQVRVKKTAVPRFKAGTGFKEVVSGAKKLPAITVTAIETAAEAVSASPTVKRVAAAVAKKAPAKKTVVKKAVAKKAPARKAAPAAKKAVAKKAPAKKAVAKKAPAKKAVAKKAPAKKAVAKKAPAKKAVAKRAPAKKAVAKKAAPAKKAVARKAPARKAPAKKA